MHTTMDGSLCCAAPFSCRSAANEITRSAYYRGSRNNNNERRSEISLIYRTQNIIKLRNIPLANWICASECK